MLILKLGGAAITNKAETDAPPRTTPHLQAIAQTLARHPQPLVLVHGAGSFGHGIAKTHQLASGYQRDSQRDALVQLADQLATLNQAVMRALSQAGLRALAVHPASMCITHNGRIHEFFSLPIERILAQGLVPVLYGDCVWDNAQGFSILSGDQLVAQLARVLAVSRIAFGTNVEGVLDAAGRPLAVLSDFASFSEGRQAGADVTGGMRGKLAELEQLIPHPATAHIFNLNDLGQLTHLLRGQAVGTTIDLSTEKRTP